MFCSKELNISYLVSPQFSGIDNNVSPLPLIIFALASDSRKKRRWITSSRRADQNTENIKTRLLPKNVSNFIFQMKGLGNSYFDDVFVNNKY